jgi:mannose-6-phosphate isomerase class I
LGGGVVVFEVQENSDVTFRLYDWNHVDAKTGKPRALQVDRALACIDFGECAGGLVVPVVEATEPVERERLFRCEHFRLSRLQSRARARSSTAGPLMPSEKATYFSCRRSSERVLFGRRVR